MARLKPLPIGDDGTTHNQWLKIQMGKFRCDGCGTLFDGIASSVVDPCKCGVGGNPLSDRRHPMLDAPLHPLPKQHCWWCEQKIEDKPEFFKEVWACHSDCLVKANRQFGDHRPQD